MTRIVVLPKDLERRLNTLTRVTQEVNGVLLYQQHGNECRVDTLRITAVGTEGHVRADPQRVDVINRFLKANPAYNFVKFHTHSVGTIEKYGRHYATNFSAGDIQSYVAQISEDPTFIGMLATPETKLLWGSDSPQLRVVDSYPGYHQWSTGVKKAFRILGETESRMPATMAR